MAAISQRPARYAGTAKWIHWLTALSFIIVLPLGILIGDAEPGAYKPEVLDRLYHAHRSFGMLILMLAVLRVIVRRVHGAPAPAAHLNRFERIASVAAHHLLYVLIFAVPLLGWLATAVYGAPVNVFGLFTIPPLPNPNENLAGIIFRVHKAGAILMTLIVLAHVAGALKHAFARDGVFSRMLPGG